MATLPSSTSLPHSIMSIKNIVVSAEANAPIDIDYVSTFLPYFSHRNVPFNSLNLKMIDSGVCQLFPNGKLLVIGGKTENETNQIFDMCMQELLKIGHPIDYTDYRIQDIVAC